MLHVGEDVRQPMGFGSTVQTQPITLDYHRLMQIFNTTPGFVIDKLNAVFAVIRPAVVESEKRGIVFAYYEAQSLSDHALKEQFPLSLLLDLFQSLKRQDGPFMLVLAGLPTLFPKLVESRTYAERMFRVVFLKQLSEAESRDAINKPIQAAQCPVRFGKGAVSLIYDHSAGYPYFIQFICREAFDSYLQQSSSGQTPFVPLPEIVRKLDTDFFAGRWAKVTDRQQDLLYVIASLESKGSEFTVQEVVLRAEQILEKPFGRSHINQLLSSLITSGLVYRDRHGKYLFAVPLMGQFILRTMANPPAP